LRKKILKKESSLPPTKGCHEVWPVVGGIIQFVKISQLLDLGDGFSICRSHLSLHHTKQKYKAIFG
jgi:hypothetical protein